MKRQDLPVPVRNAIIVAERSLLSGAPFKRVLRGLRDDLRHETRTRSTEADRQDEEAVRNLRRRGDFYLRYAEYLRHRLRHIRRMGPLFKIRAD